MSRVVKKHDDRKNEIISVAGDLFAQKGYAETSVADILDAVGIAKGTFYHYFCSKEDLLEELVKKFTDSILPLMAAVADDIGLSALEKVARFFTVTGNFSAINRTYVLTIGKAIFADSNLLTRHKLLNRNIELFAPLFSRIIRQGITEGVFKTDFPDEAAIMVMLTSRDLKERLGHQLFELDDVTSRALIERTFLFWADTVERLLGAPPGILQAPMREYLKQYMNEA